LGYLGDPLIRRIPGAFLDAPAGKQVMHGGIFLEQALVATPPKARWPPSKLDILDKVENGTDFFSVICTP